MLSPKLIVEFKQIMKEEYGVELNDMDAHRAATNLVGYFDLLLKIEYESRLKENQEAPIAIISKKRNKAKNDYK